MSTAIEKIDRSLPARAVSISAFEQALGGREALFEILSQADSTPEIQELLGFIGDPTLTTTSLAAICRMANLTAGDVFLAYERALQTRARVLARVPIAEKLPDVARDAMKKALLHEIKCPECYGRGKQEHKVKKGETEIFEVRLCYPCEGTGKISREPDLDQQKLALELGEFCQKSGLTINNTNKQEEHKTLNLSMGSTLARLQASAAEAAFAPDATAPTAGNSVEGEIHAGETI